VLRLARTLSALSAAGAALPRRLVLQCGNTSAQNKNRFVLGLLAVLIRGGLMDECSVRFLHKGHTKCSQDQLFACFKEMLELLGAFCFAVAGPGALPHLSVLCSQHHVRL
jgi:hypothetical protein